MTSYPTNIHGPTGNAPSVTERYAACNVCGVQWQIRGPDNADANACAFCGAPAQAIAVCSEAPDFGGA